MDLFTAMDKDLSRIDTVEKWNNIPAATVPYKNACVLKIL